MMESTARKVFGENGDPIGKRMVLTKKLMSSPDVTPNSGGTVYTIQAIIKDIPQNNSLNFCNRIGLMELSYIFREVWDTIGFRIRSSSFFPEKM